MASIYKTLGTFGSQAGWTGATMMFSRVRGWRPFDLQAALQPPPPPPPPPPTPPATPPPPPPPPTGECVSNTEYPEVTQTLGSGLSWLCYRNVTFSGSLMHLTVDVNAMSGDAAHIIFDRCRWLNGAVLQLLAGNDGTTVGALNIDIIHNTFEDALLSPEGVFPPQTNITIKGNRFHITKMLNHPAITLSNPTCIVMDQLKVRDHSAFTLDDNLFEVLVPSGRAVYVVNDALAVTSNSLFAMVNNTFTLNNADGTAFYLQGKSTSYSLRVLDNSAVVIQSNTVTKTLLHFAMFTWKMHVESRSAVVLRNNDVMVGSSLLHVEQGTTVHGDSWLQLERNLARGDLTSGLAYISSKVSLAESTVAVGSNLVVSTTGKPSILGGLMSSQPDVVQSTMLLHCNKVNDDDVASYEIPPAYDPTIVSCTNLCSPVMSCFPAYTAATHESGNGCVCECAEGGHGEMCLPVDTPSDGVDSCVRDVTVTWEVMEGSGKSVVCYVGVTFTADVVVDVGAMSGDVRNVTLVNCTMAGSASLYVVGWESNPPVGQRVEVWISGLASRSGGGVLLAKRYPLGSRVTVLDSMLVAEKPITYRESYDLGGASACLVLFNLDLTGSVLTVARTHVVAVFGDSRGVLVAGSVALSSGGALYMERLWVQTALGLCVSFEGNVRAGGGSVLAFVDNDLLLCKHAVSVRGTFDVAGSVVAFVRTAFAATQEYAVAFHSTVSFGDGSMLLMKANTHDSSEKEMVYVSGTVKASGSTLSFARNEGQYSRMLSVDFSLGAGSHLKAACNSVGGKVLTTETEYAAAGFGNAARIEVVGCEKCDKDAYCYASGTASAAEEGGDCVCTCSSSGHGEVCVPVEGVTLPPAPTPPSSFVLENATVRSTVVVPTGVSEVTLRHVELDGVQTVVYVPWTASTGVRIVVQDVSLRNGAVLYVMGGMGLRRSNFVRGVDNYIGHDGDNHPVELSICSIFSGDGAIALTGSFPADSILSITDSLLATTGSTSFLYTSTEKSAGYAPGLLLSSLRLVRSALIVYGVSIVSAMVGGSAVVADGTVFELSNSGIAMDALVLGGEFALYAGVQLTASDSSALRVSESELYAGRGLVFDKGVAVSRSALVIEDNTGTLRNGALLTLKGVASFVSSSWLLLQGNKFPGKLLSLPSRLSNAEFVGSTLTLYNNSVGSTVVMDGSMASASAGRNFVVGCLTHNGKPLLPSDFESVGIKYVTRVLECGACGVDVSCFGIMTREVLGTCECVCVRGVYERGCLPVFMPHPDGCNELQLKPMFTYTATLTKSRSLTLTSTMTPRPTPTLTPAATLRPTPTLTLAATPTVTLSLTQAVTEPPVAAQSVVGVGFALFSGIVAALLTIALFVAGGLGSILEIQTLGAFALMSCAPDYVRDSSVALPYFLSVFASLGPLWMVVGNALIAAVFGCVHYGLTLAFERWRGVETVSAWAATRFPSLTYLVAYLMHLGIFVGSIFMLAMPDARAQHYVIGVLGALYGVAFPIATCYFIAHHCAGASFMKYLQFSHESVYKRWLYPIGYWSPLAQQHMYSSILTNMKGNYLYWCVFRLAVLCVMVIMGGQIN
ncbi:Dispersed gene family protein 1 [Trypanosoma melophagium]|uniref:Dispersed gene family protein 1 n=1 Tax=Trypanosoma melophagium TaxID=715481 RepID=UPI00351A2069|nr:Dispersed gene family protein 1 [Trypanosoma melophagium]